MDSEFEDEFAITPVALFEVESRGLMVILTLTAEDGTGDRFFLPKDDALKIGLALTEHASLD